MLQVALVGRPNTGKSTLFNRLMGRRLALVDDHPGVTRDRREGVVSWASLSFTLVDTAGLDEAKGHGLTANMQEQTCKAIAQADIVLFLLDARAGVIPMDHHYATVIRRMGKPVFVLMNKAEGAYKHLHTGEAFSLGFGTAHAISSEHGEGLEALYDLLQEAITKKDQQIRDVPSEETAGEDGQKPLSLAIIGRPNTGKSTLINALLGEDRLLTGPEAGITRDSISVDWTWNGRPLRLFDTAGLRRKSRIQHKLEKLSVADTLRALRFAQSLILTIDATQGFEKQDLQIIELSVNEGRAVFLGLSKWDLLQKKDRAGTLRFLQERAGVLLDQIPGIPLVPFSAKTGYGLDALMKTVFSVHHTWTRRLSTGQLNRWFQTVVAAHAPPHRSGGRPLRLRYITQIKTGPPHFVLFCSSPEKVPASYQRYLLNALRKQFAFDGIPLRLSLRRGENPYV